MSTEKMPSKKRGRPVIDSEAIQVRVERPDLEAIDKWRCDQPNQPGRPEAIRRLVRKALAE